jgi:hypothetical protein
MKKVIGSLVFAMVLVLSTAGGSKIALAGGPMKMAHGWSIKANETEAVKEALAMMKKGLGGDTPKLVVVFTTGMKYDEKKVFTGLKNRLKPGVRLWGLNSDIVGTARPEGMYSGLTVMGFYSPSMVVGVGSSKLDWRNYESYRGVGKKAVLAALKDAGKSATEPPSVLFFAGMHLVTDTKIFRGIEEVIGEVPMWGGNAGRDVKNIVIGDGWCFSNNGVEKDSVSVAAIWTDTRVGVAYGYGYTERPQYKGIVTKANPPKRIIYEIDHRPAADVYDEWTGGKVTDIIKAGGGPVPLPILGRYGLKKPIKKDVSDYVILGVLVINPDKSVLITHEPVNEGVALSLIELAIEKELVKKPAIVATIARNRGKIHKQNIAGALLVYCSAPFMVAQGKRYDIQPTFPLLSKSLSGAPFIGALVGGEIGHSPLGGNRMTAFSDVVIVFGKN